ncbi:hypothetical protein [Ekhidna sp.]|uniref:hypothetical protein n=1 Tax=Ekhidna sp. TaxID=2608089 RepID=UPI003CCBCCCF
MKIINKLLPVIAFIAVFVFTSCKDEALVGPSSLNNVVYLSDTSASVSEAGGSTALVVARTTSDYSSSLSVSVSVSAVYATTTEFANAGDDATGSYTINKTTVEFASNVSQDTIIVTAVDDLNASGPKLVTVTLSEASGYTIGTDEKSSFHAFTTVEIVDNDCPIPSIVGEFSVTTTDTSPAGCDGVTNVVTITKVSDNPDGSTTYSMSDVTGGLYANCYGSADNPGNIVVAADGTTVTMTAQPDVVYGGDQFDGTGEIDACASKMIIDWSNGFGDSGTTEFPL